MAKRNRIIYWIATVWLSLGMMSSGIIQVIQQKEEVDSMSRLGYPPYFLSMLGTWKFLGVIAVLIPKFPLIKEWAYAGFFFTMSGALYTHIVVGDEAKEFFGPVLLLLLIAISWYFRPSDRKMTVV